MILQGDKSCILHGYCNAVLISNNCLLQEFIPPCSWRVYVGMPLWFLGACQFKVRGKFADNVTNLCILTLVLPVVERIFENQICFILATVLL